MKSSTRYAFFLLLFVPTLKAMDFNKGGQSSAPFAPATPSGSGLHNPNNKQSQGRKKLPSGGSSNNTHPPKIFLTDVETGLSSLLYPLKPAAITKSNPNPPSQSSNKALNPLKPATPGGSGVHSSNNNQDQIPQIIYPNVLAEISDERDLNPL